MQLKKYFSEIGGRGGKNTSQKYGKKHFRALQKLSAAKRVANRKLSTVSPLDK